jgi:fibronectin-binding autotransporter adhesin
MAGTFSSYSSSTYSLTTNPTTVTSSGTIDVNSTIAFVPGIFGTSGVAWTLTNLGTVESIGSQGLGILLQSGGLVTNGASASTAAYVNATATAIQIEGTTSGVSGTVVNFGTVRAVSTNGNSDGVLFFHSPSTTQSPVGTVTNYGTIIAGAVGTSGSGIGVQLGGGGTVVNSGLINAAYGQNEGGVVSFSTGATLVNTGTILAAGTTTGIGVNLNSGSVNNSGLVSGSSTGINLGSGGVGTVVNSGTILATNSGTAGTVNANGIFLGGGGTITNLGTVSVPSANNGIAVNFGTAGGKLVNGTAGGTIGVITAYHDAVFSPTGGAATTIVNYGTIQSTQTGTASGTGFTGFAVILNSIGTIDNFGTIVGSETASLGGRAAISMPAGGSITNGSTAATTALIQGSGGNAINIHGLTTITNFGTLASTGSSSTIYFLNAGGTVTNGATNSTAALIEGNLASPIHFHDVAGTVTNYGTILQTGHGTSGGQGIYLGAGGIVTNATGASITSYHSGISVGTLGAATVTNFGTIENTGSASGSGIAFAHGGTLTNQTSGVVTAIRNAVSGIGGPTTVVNSGLIQNSAIGATILIRDGGSVTNTASGTIAGPNSAIVFNNISGTAVSVGSVVNSGTIQSTSTASASAVYFAQGGALTNQASGVIEAATGNAVTFKGTVAGTVSNFGVIKNSGSAAAAIYSAAGVTVTNAAGATISSDIRVGVSVHNFAGTIDNSGTIQSTAPTSLTQGTGVYLGGGGLITNRAGGLIFALRDAVTLGISPTSAAATVINAGTITGSVGVKINLADTGDNTIVNYGTITGTGGIAIRLGGGNDRVVIEPGSTLVGAVGNFNAGDTFDLPVVTYDTAGSANLLAGNVLQIIENGGTATINLDPSEDFTGDFFHLAGDGSAGTLITEDTAPCYCRGTLILTPTGEVAVEDLAVGDLVETVWGEAKPIRWIGRRAYDGRFVAGNRAVLPIRIEAGAIARGLPARDLWVSPEHALYIDGFLVPAAQLVNHASITQAAGVERIEYFHIELDEHDIIVAEGMPAETFVDCDNRGMFQNAGEYAALYPADERPGWQFCAKRLGAGAPELAAIREALWARAEALGYELTDDPDPHLVIGGEIVPAQSVAGAAYRFDVTAGAGAIWLGSRSVVPAEVDGGSQDGRRLGACIERILLYDADLCVEVGHAHYGLCDGFHDDELSHRWTNGMARLPDLLVRPFAGDFTVEVHLIPGGLRYPLRAPEISSPSEEAISV